MSGDSDDLLLNIQDVGVVCPMDIGDLLLKAAHLCNEISSKRRSGAVDRAAEYELLILYGQALERKRLLEEQMGNLGEAVKALQRLAA